MQRAQRAWIAILVVVVLSLPIVAACTSPRYTSATDAAQSFAEALLTGDDTGARQALSRVVSSGELERLRVEYFGRDEPTTGAVVVLTGEDEGEGGWFFVDSVQWPDGSESQPSAGTDDAPPMIYVAKQGRTWFVTVEDEFDR